MSLLLCGAVGVVADAADGVMLRFVTETTAALAGHHPADASTVTSALAQVCARPCESRSRAVREPFESRSRAVGKATAQCSLGPFHLPCAVPNGRQTDAV
jgi:hypothetical protein